MAKPTVVIVGAGFGGLACARGLAGKNANVLLIDRNNYHLFTPLLYQVASSLLNPSDIAQPVRSIFRGKRNVRFLQAEVTGVDFERRAVHTTAGEHAYDYLVLAPGSTTNFFGLHTAEERAQGLKDLPEALELRNHILRCLETASHLGPDEAAPWLTFVVVGGGPTGVEYAGALSELLRHVVPGEYPELASRRIRILLIEAQDNVLPPFPPGLRAAAAGELRKRRIELLLDRQVTGLEGDRVKLSGGDELEAKTLVWAAGVRPAPLTGALDVPRTPRQRIEVDEFLRVRSRDGVFAIGDAASVQQDGQEIAMLAGPAMQEGHAVAANILRLTRGEPLRPFHYRDRGSMATIGKNAAVAELGPIHLSGFLGWATWLVVHLYLLIGFRNRLVVLAGWAWNYFRSDRPVRLITRAKGEG